jgi:hypothetical protein
MANARYAQNWQGTSEMNHSRGFRQLFGSDSDGDAQAISDALATLTDCVPTELVIYDYWFRPAAGVAYPAGTFDRVKVIARTATGASATYFLRNLDSATTPVEIRDFFVTYLAHPVTGEAFTGCLVAAEL